MKLTNKFPYLNTLHFYNENNEEYIGSKNRTIYIKKKGRESIYKLPLTPLDFFSISRYLSRLFRLDRVNILAHNESFLLVLRQKNIFYIDLETNSFYNTLKLNKTRNILLNSSVCINSQVFFGDYGLNKINKIYKSNNNGKSWKVVYKFLHNECKQILKIAWDKFEEQYWVLCGDEIGEAKFIIFDKDFNKVIEFFDNSLKYRAISIYFFKDKITWVTNDPYDGSKVYSFKRKTRKVHLISSIEGSVWYSTETSDGLFVIATVSENLKFDDSSLVKIYLSDDFINWRLEAVFKKDCLPKKFFRFGIASFPSGNFSSKDLPINFEAIKKYDGDVIHFKF